MKKLENKYLKIAHECAEASGKIIKKYFRKKVKIEIKNDNTPVTKADKEAEKKIRDIIRKKSPECGYFGEETGKYNIDNEYTWVIDPIDGTKSFITGKPLFGTLIGLMKNNRPYLGVLNQPILKERWVGIANKESRFNNVKVKTRNCKKLKGSKMYATSPMMFVGKNQKVYRNVRAKIGETLFGADCYAHGLMASGFIDVLLEANLKPYDYIASAAIVSGAGGKFTDWQGNELNLKSDGRIIAAGDAKIHNQLIKVIKKIK
ncbi:MAG: Fructose-1,6-bisphosphatase/inositol-1-monophosphatase [Alphaproteobacteria bacterium MarineAlpha6_Bin6]|nr:MAG: Fructose-1,6-bisphosphatase/inositol-1-monophosphatase [Alphaproteobacteria bacterium MarineAlpha6_Bin6]PPR34001.1 MAG: Fructose-1,6-bisphosphatase/inositol-1-monophosphatase [Alphaproteobacteria bacterium MarineAlpha6_Bin5]|tara:strand:- start:1480 stop:2262 length:783 start_codon:yes stop_codon:yes gene_type:complete